MRGMDTSPLQAAISLVGLSKLARGCDVTHQAVRKWQAARRMPRTEWTGETNYSTRIEQMTQGEVTRQALMAAWPALDVADSHGANVAAPAPARHPAVCGGDAKHSTHMGEAENPV